MHNPEMDRILSLQKQFQIFVGKKVYTVAEAEALGLIRVHVHEHGGLSYSETAPVGFDEDTLTLR